MLFIQLTESLSPVPSNHARQLPEGFKQEMEDWKSQMMGAIHDRINSLQEHFSVFSKTSSNLQSYV